MLVIFSWHIHKLPRDFILFLCNEKLQSCLPGTNKSMTFQTVSQTGTERWHTNGHRGRNSKQLWQAGIQLHSHHYSRQKEGVSLQNSWVASRSKRHQTNRKDLLINSPWLWWRTVKLRSRKFHLCVLIYSEQCLILSQHHKALCPQWIST